MTTITIEKGDLYEIMSVVKTENSPAPESYRALLGDIKERIRSAQYAALRAVNQELIRALLGYRTIDC